MLLYAMVWPLQVRFPTILLLNKADQVGRASSCVWYNGCCSAMLLPLSSIREVAHVLIFSYLS